MPNKNLKRTKNWKALTTHQKTMGNTHMRDLFSEDEDRANKFSITLGGLHLDYSKNLINDETKTLLLELAEKAELKERIDALFAGEKINTTENRAAIHAALRGPITSAEIDGERVGNFVASTRQRMEALTEKIRDNPNITDVISIGIGGSDLGPHMVCRALAPFCDGPKIHFVSNVDGTACNTLMQNLDPQNTLIIIASKTFTTLETMRNAQTLLNWMTGLVGQHAMGTHVIALTMNEDAAQNMGIPSDHILPLRDWIGGRYSVWSVIGLPVAIAIGFDHFEKFLSGGHQMDLHFRDTPFEKNMPVILALLGIWYRNFFDYTAHAVLPYAQYLQHLPDYLQQLDMESNGKSVNLAGQKLEYETAPVLFGAPGTNSQHAFVQALHQGTDIIPADFIIVAFPEHSLLNHHKYLLANALAQTQALMQGDENTNEPHKSFPGNRPSNTIILDRLDGYHLGMLLTLYEYKTFVQGALWNINSFDQYGVELGKTLAKDLISAFDSGGYNLPQSDSSTQNLLRYLKQRI